MAKHTFALTFLAGVVLGVLGALKHGSFRLAHLQKIISSSSPTEAYTLAATEAALLSRTCSHFAARAYHWLAAHPYPAVIGGMVVYLLVMMTVSSLLDKGRSGHHEELQRKYQEYQRFQHHMRLRRWQQQHPEQQQQQQQPGQQQQEQSSSKWGGVMGFGVQPVPEGCKGAVKDVLSAMDYYEVLGVPWEKVNSRALKTARKAKALSVHPDKVGRDTPGCDLAGSRVNMAFEALSNAQLRKEYDDWLSQQF